ncbi:uncharacterized protein LOC131733790 [Acipenser ruthenus]|uniref:uncharacterized protein LOC131733790 n=1 Tax=Acipenser ruthenus TaxID=7906 RepID=UPI0027406D73|nr:uncharacterized protein LOC131733790 [Acipenser ruthenus]
MRTGLLRSVDPPSPPNLNFLGQLQEFQSALALERENEEERREGEERRDYDYSSSSRGDRAQLDLCIVAEEGDCGLEEDFHRDRAELELGISVTVEEGVCGIEEDFPSDRSLLELDECVVAEEGDCGIEEDTRGIRGEGGSDSVYRSFMKIFKWGEKVLLRSLLGAKSNPERQEVRGGGRQEVGGASPPPFVLSMPACKHRVFTQRHLAASGEKSCKIRRD